MSQLFVAAALLFRFVNNNQKKNPLKLVARQETHLIFEREKGF